MRDLEALVVAAYVFADEYRVPARQGRPALTSDAEVVALAVAQAAIGISSDRQFLGLVGRVLPGWFPHLPDQSQYNRRLRALVGLLSIVQQRLARWLDRGGVRLSDGTLIGVANYPGCQQRSEFVGFDRFGISIIVPDEVRVRNVLALARAGHTRRILLSHDSIVCWRGRPVPYGQTYDEVLALVPDWRPTTILTKIVPQLLDGGLTPADVETILVDNPRRLFSPAA